MALPVLTTGSDVDSIVGYLKTKPTGASLEEAKAVLKRQVLDGRKLNAYQAWGFVARENGSIKLTTRGWELARKPEAEAEIFRMVIDDVRPYRSALEWMYHQGMDTATNIDVAAHWHEHHSDALGTTNEGTIKDNAVCFFHLVEKAGIGKLTIGRHGHATRIDLHRDALAGVIESGPASPPWDPQADPIADANQATTDDSTLEAEDATKPPLLDPAPEAPEDLRVFIAHGPNMEIVEQVETMLEVAGIDGEIAEAEETVAIPVPEKVFTAMRRCNAAIICVTVDEAAKDDAGNYTLNYNVLIEIGTAFVLYDRQVVLVWDKRLPVPSNLQGLYRCEFEGNELSWNAGMKLMKAIRGFKRAGDSAPDNGKENGNL
jgi:Predicted nucleotide-binding protein containing TIR-like domain